MNNFYEGERWCLPCHHLRAIHNTGGKCQYGHLRQYKSGVHPFDKISFRVCSCKKFMEE